MTDDIRQFVEKARQFMYDLAAEKGLDHPDVLAASQALDDLLNDFQKKSKAKKLKKHLRIEDRRDGYAVVIDHVDASYEINDFVTFREAVESAYSIADQSKRPRLRVYYKGKLIPRNE